MLNNKNEFLQALNNLTEGNTSDEVLDIIQFASNIDTDNSEKITDLENQLSALQTERDNLDKEWREKYRSAFFSPPDQRYNEPLEKRPQGDNVITIKDLFKPKE